MTTMGLRNLSWGKWGVRRERNEGPKKVTGPVGLMENC